MKGIYNKFLTVKTENAERYLSEDERAHLKILLKIIEDGRKTFWGDELYG